MDAETYFNRIYNATYSAILKFIVIKTNNADAVEDILQNVYQSFFTRISTKGFGDIRNPEAFLIRFTQKELSRHYRKKAVKGEMETDFEGIGERAEADDIPFDQIVDNESVLRTVQDIALGLPLLSYKSFVMFYYYDMSIAQIAQNLHVSENNVKNRLWRARNVIRKGIKGEMV